MELLGRKIDIFPYYERTLIPFLALVVLFIFAATAQNVDYCQLFRCRNLSNLQFKM